MSDINRVTLFGRLTKDPETKYTQSGTAITSFSIANNKTWNQDGEKKSQVSYFECTAWGKLGEIIAQYISKGNRILIEGRLQQQSWDDSEGKKRYAIKVIVENFNFIDSKQKNETSSDEKLVGTPATVSTDPDNPFSDEDIPF